MIAGFVNSNPYLGGPLAQYYLRPEGLSSPLRVAPAVDEMLGKGSVEELRDYLGVGANWGNIGGTLSDQVDLVDELNKKANFTDVASALNGKADKFTSITGRYSLTGGGDLSAHRQLNLVGDVPIPGVHKLYGTNASGNRGWTNHVWNFGEWVFGPEELVVTGTRLLGYTDRNLVVEEIRLAVGGLLTDVTISGWVHITGGDGIGNDASIPFTQSFSNLYKTSRIPNGAVIARRDATVHVEITNDGSAYGSSCYGFRVDLFGYLR